MAAENQRHFCASLSRVSEPLSEESVGQFACIVATWIHVCMPGGWRSLQLIACDHQLARRQLRQFGARTLKDAGRAEERDWHGMDDHFEEDKPSPATVACRYVIGTGNNRGKKMNPASNSARLPKPPGGEAATLFRLYIADETIAAEQAVLNLKTICEDHMEGRYEVETVDILQQPLRAMSEGVLLTPALLRLTPLPVRKVVGDLSDSKAVLHALGFSDRAKNDKL